MFTRINYEAKLCILGICKRIPQQGRSLCFFVFMDRSDNILKCLKTFLI